MSNDIKLTRRQFLQGAAVSASAAMLVSALPSLARAEDLPPLSEADPTATALGYKEDATKVDLAKFPQHKPTQLCSNCNFFQGTGARAPCTLFPGKSVNAKGWCSAYAAKVA